MRISATGKAKAKASANSAAEQGFTLIELLIVLTIIGLMSAAVVLAMPDGSGNLRSEAEAFAARAQAAQERAILDSRSIAMRVTQEGYEFQRRQGGEWRPISDKPLTPVAWAQGTSGSVGDTEPARVIFDSTGMTEPVELVLRSGDEQLVVGIGADGRSNVGD